MAHVWKVTPTLLYSGMWRPVRATRNRRCAGTCYLLSLFRECSLFWELIANKVIKKFSTFCPIVTPINVSTTARLYSVCWSRLIHSVLTIQFFLKIHFNIIHTPTSGCPFIPITLVFFASLLCLLHASYILSSLCISNCIWHLFLRVGCVVTVPAFGSNFWQLIRNFFDGFLIHPTKGLLLIGHLTIFSPSSTLKCRQLWRQWWFPTSIVKLQPNLERNLNNYGVTQQIYSDYY
jgi:hypothetical protein